MKEKTEEEKMVKARVIEIIADQLGRDASEITEQTSMSDDLGADSLDAVEVIMAIEEEYNLEIDDEDAMNFKTVQDVIDYVEKNK